MKTKLITLKSKDRMNTTAHSNSHCRLLKPIALACIAVFAGSASSIALAQSYHTIVPTPITSGNATNPTPVNKVGDVDYGATAKVARVVVEVEKDQLPADGVSGNLVTVKLFDAQDKPVTESVLITIEHSAGRVLISGAKTDEMGPGRTDVDRTTPGVQLKVINGVGTFQLLAPFQAGDIKLRITAGPAVAEGSVGYLPELREMVAAGLIEGIINVHRKPSSSIIPTRVGDGFEQELRYWQREFSNGKSSIGARVAFYLKGTVKGDMLLTMAADSDKNSKDRLNRDIDPNKFYPVYGDSSITGFDARSREKLFVRLDKGKSYALYGDFSTGDGFSQIADGGAVASTKSRNLGNYNRSLTGLRGHLEDKSYILNGFASYDNLKQLVEEYSANGTSGPFAVSSSAGLEGSEKVEILTRDRNALDRVIGVVAQVRLADYSFEPFSGRILFKAPIASVDINGNPQSIRITYEVEQGGPRFWTFGVDGQLRVTTNTELGGSYVSEDNPLAPYKLASANITTRINERSVVVLEVAKSKATLYANPSGVTATPSGVAGEFRGDLDGNAYRVEANYAQGAMDSRLWWLRADKQFYNPAASVSAGRTEAGASVKYALTDAFSAYVQGQKTTEGLQIGEPSRKSLALGVIWKPSDRLTVDASVRKSREGAGFTPSSTFASNSQSGGGFFGGGSDAINPITNTAILPLSAGNITSAGLPNPTFANGNSLRLGAKFKATDQWSLTGEVEGSNSNEKKNRFSVGTQYQINERSRAYLNYEKTTGLTSSSSVNPSDRSNAFVLGIDNTFAAGPTVFSEFRLRDSIGAELASARDQQLATGVRNTWNISEGLAYTGSVENLKIISGNVRDAFAVAGGVDWAASELWKTSARLEYRKLSDDKLTVGRNDSQTQVLSTIAVARKLNRDWTLLGRNYYLTQNKNADGKRVEDRFQVGAAWRPVDHNRWNVLSRYEFKTAKDTGLVSALAAGDNYKAHVFSVHSDYHPARPWWFTSRVAAKVTQEKNLPVGEQSYNAYLVSGRATYDVTENWDVGLMGAYMWSPKGAAKQKAFGAEVGYLVQQNLWLSAGYNVTGFSDRDLVGTDYTNKGLYLRLRFKFDENLFSGKSKDINRTLDR
jgi:hypothetical protein